MSYVVPVIALHFSFCCQHLHRPQANGLLLNLFILDSPQICCPSVFLDIMGKGGKKDDKDTQRTKKTLDHAKNTMKQARNTVNEIWRLSYEHNVTQSVRRILTDVLLTEIPFGTHVGREGQTWGERKAGYGVGVERAVS